MASVPGEPYPIGTATLREFPREVWSWVAVRCVLGGLLIVAAALKSYDAVTGPPAPGLLGWRPLLMGVVVGEWLLGLWLIGGQRPRQTVWVALACFGAMACYTAYRAFTGAESCGCFGRLRVSPWVTLTVDLAAMAALLLTRRAAWGGAAPVCMATKRWLTVGLVVAAPAVVWLGLSRPATLGGADALADAGGGLVVLEPEAWVGKGLPLARHIDVAQRVMRGRWTLVLYHHDCPSCRARLPRYERMAEAGEQVALVEMPPYATAEQDPVPASTTCVRGRLSASREWFVQTPAEIVTEDGVVARAAQGVGH